MDVHHCVNLVPLFRQLSLSDQAKIDRLVKHREFNRGEQVITPSQDKKLVIVAKGLIKLYQLAPTGKEQLIRFIHPGEYEGEAELFDQVNSNVFGEAIVETTICYLTQVDFLLVLKEHPDISIKIMNLMAQKLHRLEKQTSFLTMTKVEERLATFLNDLEITNSSNTIKLPMKLKELANFIGTTPETLSRKLTIFENRGVIIRNKTQIKIINQDKLEDLFM